MTDNALRHLHDKATRKEPLTAEEEIELAAWYEEQDREENALLTSSFKPLVLEALRDDVENALLRLEATTRQVRAQAEENEALRRDVAALAHQFAQTKTLQSA